MSDHLIHAVVLVHAALHHSVRAAESWVEARLATRREDGQATAEYALVLLGVAAVALLVVTWAARTNRIGNLLNGVFDRISGHVG